jgi:ABC-2 type transport system permease protein
MGMFEDTLNLYKREMLVFRSNLRQNIARSIIFPLIIIVILGNVGFSAHNIPVAVVNYANNPQSHNLIGALEADNLVTLSSVTDQNTAIGMLKSGAVSLVLVILPSFPSSTQASGQSVQIYYSNTQFSAISGLLPSVESLVSRFGGPVQVSPQQIYLPQGQPGLINAAPLYGSSSNYKDFLTGGILGMVVVFGTLFSGGFSLITDKQLGNLKAMMVAPIDKNAIVASRVAAAATQSVLYASMALLIGVLDGVRIAMGVQGLPYLLFAVVVIGIGFGAVATIVASRAKKVEIFAIFAQTIGMPLWFISGGIAPVSSLPSWLQPLSVIDPLTYSTDISRNVIMVGSLDPTGFAIDCAMLLGFSIIMVAAAFRLFKPSIE